RSCRGGTRGFAGGAGGGGSGTFVGGAGGGGFGGGGGGGGGSGPYPGEGSPRGSPGGGSISVGGGFSGGTGGNGTATGGGGGGGGGALGGALYVRAGEVTVVETTFSCNRAIPGTGGAGADGNQGTRGFAYGGAIVIRADGSLRSAGGMPSIKPCGPGTPLPEGTSSDDVNGRVLTLPTVTISAGPHLTHEGQRSSSFTFTRTGVLTTTLAVDVLVGGSATFNEDYAVSGAASFSSTRGRVIIPAGAASASIDVTLLPSGDQRPRTGETIALTIANSASYVVGDVASAALAIDAIPPAWLVMLYIAADDRAKGDTTSSSIYEYALKLKNQLVTAAPQNPAMKLVVLFDGTGDNDTRLLVSNPRTGGLQEVPDSTVDALWPGYSTRQELDTGSAATLETFIRWGRSQAPRAHTFLAVIDHGGGWAPDFGGQAQPGSRGSTQAGSWRGMSLDVPSNSSLSTRETGELFEGLDSLGRFDIVFFDACLMGMIESAYQIQPYTNYFIAGQSLLWSDFPYERYLATDVLTATTSPRDFATNIVKLYNQDSTDPYAIAAWDMRRLPDLRWKTNALAHELLLRPGVDQAIHEAYTSTQKFDYNADLVLNTNTEGYVDLADFAAKLSEKSIS
ncbi:MAG: hypothetical protein HGA45_43610, partial [Chloroflexales bacterium]|nr:hypothetical protein [Chloroflexales bacterium]